MNRVLKLTAAAAILAALPACDALGLNRQSNKAAEQNEAAGSNASGNSAASDEGEGNSSASTGGKDTAAGAPAGSSEPFTGEVTRAYIVGRWTDNNDCSNVTEFTSDGRFITADGGEGIWSLNGDQLIFQGAQGRAALRVEAADANTLVSTAENGDIGRTTRCS
jgi:hypothetical protein